MNFAAHHLQEKCQEQLTDLYTLFVNLTKEFNTANRKGLCKAMAKFGCPGKLRTMVWQCHDGMMVSMMDTVEESEPFPGSNGIKQGFVLAQTLFSMISAMLSDAFQACNKGIGLRYRTDGGICNQRRLRADTKLRRS